MKARDSRKSLPPKVRIANFHEFRTPICQRKTEAFREHAVWHCGVPFCQAGHDACTEWLPDVRCITLCRKQMIWYIQGNWKQAYLRLAKTHSFPEFTSRVCPALCEAACTCNLNGEPVSTKENERAIIETAWQEGLGKAADSEGADRQERLP